MQEYNIECTGDAVVGDEVQFEQAQFAGSYRKPRFIGTRTITGRIIRDSYGAGKQQHTFTILLEDGSTLRIKGRNLYRNGTMRKPWADESARDAARAEKHHRGDAARATRQLIRSMDSFYRYA